ncbi:hypothetical protein BV25DRAFT_1821686 [Artomyces pyxidatus]|uniref:Uncharacterized protein n=1 Tax=Artomyces pyxidatus TaxID=48021 RepID=A0ACB8TBN2_9AGAM|nr:hypothetical protein BV25DRAFT_1821686 [Artomyces pyxidatus]
MAAGNLMPTTETVPVFGRPLGEIPSITAPSPSVRSIQGKLGRSRGGVKPSRPGSYSGLAI